MAEVWWMIGFTKSNLLRKHMLFTVIGLVGILGLYGFWSVEAVERSTREVLNERLAIAETMALHVDDHLQEEIALLEDAARDLADGDGISAESARSVLRNSPMGRKHKLGAFILDRKGGVILAEPIGVAATDLSFEKYTFVNDSLVKGKASISGAIPVPGVSKTGIIISVPIKDANGIVRGALLAAIDPSSPGVLGLVGTTRIGNTGYAQVVDDNGRLIVSTRPDNKTLEIDHGPRFIELIKTGQETVATCHRCHESGQRGGVDIIAFAPVHVAPWGIAIRQSQEEAFALVNDLRLKILATLIFSVVVLGALALLILKDIIAPIRKLTVAAQRITSGDFGGAIPRLGADEIGILARTLEAMRGSLNDAREEMALRHQELQAKTDELQRKEEQRRQLLDKVIQAQEEERKRIARELHDEIGQTLTALVMNLDAIQHTLPQEAEELRGKLEGFRVLAADAIKETRRLMLDLRPTLLDDLGLVPAIEWYAETYLGRAGVDLQMNARGLPRRLPSQIETVLFRVTQEAMTNTVKHAKAKRMRIRLGTQDSTVKALIKDDGQGFDVRHDGKRGMGLLGMEERVTLLGGAFHVESTPGKGTSISLEIPLAGGGDDRQDSRADS